MASSVHSKGGWLTGPLTSNIAAFLGSLRRLAVDGAFDVPVHEVEQLENVAAEAGVGGGLADAVVSRISELSTEAGFSKE